MKHRPRSASRLGVGTTSPLVAPAPLPPGTPGVLIREPTAGPIEESHVLPPDDDDDKKENPVLDMIVAAAVLKLYDQMSAMGATSGVGFVGDGAGGAIGVSIAVTA